MKLASEQTSKSQQYIGWSIVAISLVHFAVTFIDYDALSLRALWFVGSGFGLLLIGGLNVITGRLPLSQFAQMGELRALTLVADGCGVALGGLFVYMTSGSQPQGPVLVLLFGAAALIQLRRPRPKSDG